MTRKRGVNGGAIESSDVVLSAPPINPDQYFTIIECKCWAYLNLTHVWPAFFQGKGTFLYTRNRQNF